MKDAAQVIAELTATNSELHQRLSELEKRYGSVVKKRAYSPTDIARKRYKCLDFDRVWSDPFGTPPENELWFISGPSASGKSSFVMQLSKRLCAFGSVLYESYEEKISQSFQERILLFHMNEVQGRFKVATDDTYGDLVRRLEKPKSPRFIVVDSFQVSDWSYEDAVDLRRRFPSKSFST